MADALSSIAYYGRRIQVFRKILFLVSFALVTSCSEKTIDINRTSAYENSYDAWQSPDKNVQAIRISAISDATVDIRGIEMTDGFCTTTPLARLASRTLIYRDSIDVKLYGCRSKITGVVITNHGHYRFSFDN